MSLIAAQGPGQWPAVDQTPPVMQSWAQPVLIRANISTNLLPVVDLCPTKGNWAITYDDGPSIHTRKILQLLKQHKVKATFFVVGSRVVENPEILREVYKDGHQIALHSWSHSNFVELSDAEIVTDVLWNIKAVKDAIGVTPTMFRPPYGAYDERVQRILTAMGIQIIIWNRDTKDYQIGSNELTENQVYQNVQGWMNETMTTGNIVLQHDIATEVVATAPRILEIIKQSGASVMSVGQCLQTKWYREQATSMRPATVSANQQKSKLKAASASGKALKSLKTPERTRTRRNIRIN